jgi:hypothetical protein
MFVRLRLRQKFENFILDEDMEALKRYLGISAKF